MPDVRCPVCGINTPEGKFCEHCGSSLAQVTPQAPQLPTSPAQVPTKKRSTGVTILIVIGIIVVVFIVIVFAAAFIYAMTVLPDTTSGTTIVYPTTTKTYTYSPTSVITYVTSSSRSWHVVNSYTETIGNGYYWYYYIPLKNGDSMRAVFSTDGSPLDLMVMRSGEFKKYQAAISSPPGNWNAWNDLNIVKDQYDFTAPSDDTYYFVFDNTNSPTNGAYAKKSINLVATFSKYY